MKRQMMAMGAGLLAFATVLPAQSGGGFSTGSTFSGYGSANTPMEFQQAGTMGTVTACPTTVGRTASGSAPLAVIGRPVSATEERKSVQTLGDGTEITNSETNLYYRDGHGRVRVEQNWQGKTVIGILDPVGMYFIDLDPANKTARRTVIQEGMNRGGISISNGMVSKSWASSGGGGGLSATGVATAGSYAYSTASGGSGGVLGGIMGSMSTAAAAPMPPRSTAGGGGGAGGGGSAAAIMRSTGGAPGTPVAGDLKNEDLGVQSQNGVLASGNRSTLTIPRGQIGNNRDIHVVNEKWYSDDLQMLVKSVNSDPRFGDNIYQLTNVLRSEPDPALFQIPADYTVTDLRSASTAPRPAVAK